MFIKRNPRVKPICYLCNREIEENNELQLTTGDDGYNIVVIHKTCNFKEYRKD